MTDFFSPESPSLLFFLARFSRAAATLGTRPNSGRGLFSIERVVFDPLKRRLEALRCIEAQPIFQSILAVRPSVGNVQIRRFPVSLHGLGPLAQEIKHVPLPDQGKSLHFRVRAESGFHPFVNIQGVSVTFHVIESEPDSHGITGRAQGFDPFR